ncbi:Uncharacterised protein [Salmonella enterica subsp. arizonae]|nr:Uncharacterised protein [Salmonella enterica subsp. arizonae]
MAACALSGNLRRQNLVQFFRALHPVTFERTLHVFNCINDVMMNKLFVLDTDTTTAVAFQQQVNSISAHTGSQNAIVRYGENRRAGCGPAPSHAFHDPFLFQ